MIKIKREKLILYFALSLLTLLLLLLISFTFYHRLGAFGCFDQCFSFVAAKFMLKGKSLYSEIFFNHQPLAAYLSFLLQKLLLPQDLYHLILFHRLFIIIFSFLANLFLIYRFRWTGLSFVLFYESTKYYLFGNAFLPEAFAVYPLVFLFGLVWERLKKLSFPHWNYSTAGLAAWSITFLTLPYVPVTLLLIISLLFLANTKKARFLIVFSFLIPTLITLVSLPFGDYLFDLFVVNQKIITDEARGTGMTGLGAIKTLFYPLLIFSRGQPGFFKTILTLLDSLFLFSAGLLAIKFNKNREVLFTLIILGCALTRFVPPGKVFYESFHLLPWYSLFLFSLPLFIQELFTLYPAKKHQIPTLLFLSLLAIFVYITNSPFWFVWEKIDSQEEFSINYTHYYTLGQTIKGLSSPQDTLFLDLWDDLIYWEANLDSAYSYSLYPPIATTFTRFTTARLKMFQENPPDFYYSFCDQETLLKGLFPDEVKNNYTRVFSNKKPTCFYIKKTKLLSISQKQWETAKSFGFNLPTPDQKTDNNPNRATPAIEIIKP